MLMSSKFLPVTCFVCPEYSYWECKYWQPPSRPYYWGPNWLVWNSGAFCVFTFDPESSFYFSIWALPHLSLAGCWNQQVNLHSCFYVSLHQNIAIIRRETFVEALGVLDINHLTDKNQEILGLCWLQRWSGLLLKKKSHSSKWYYFWPLGWVQVSKGNLSKSKFFRTTNKLVLPRTP